MLPLLRTGRLEVTGRLVEASNATLLATVALDGTSRQCVYKPVAGERPLWDFPDRTLGRREAAAYVLSTALGWGVVPPTVFRPGPFGAGSVQLWVDDGTRDAEGDPEVPEAGAGVVDVIAPGKVPRGWLNVVVAEDYRGRTVVLAHADDPDLARMALFDAVANNADRKGGHILRDRWGRLRGVDHGLTFNTEDKLRTVLWGWEGDPLPAAEREQLAVLADQLRELCRAEPAEMPEPAELDEPAGAVELAPLPQTPGAAAPPQLADLLDLLSLREIRTTARRAARLAQGGRFPAPATGRPAIPWPAF